MTVSNLRTMHLRLSTLSAIVCNLIGVGRLVVVGSSTAWAAVAALKNSALNASGCIVATLAHEIESKASNMGSSHRGTREHNSRSVAGVPRRADVHS